MITFVVVALIVLALAVVMTMTGRGGGNFYVLTLVLAGIPVHEAATTGQFILMLTAIAGMLIFHKNRMIDWKLALVIDPPTDIMALVGGYYSHLVSGTALKLSLASLLVVAGACMFLKVKDRPLGSDQRFGFWRRDYDGQSYVVNLWLAIPITAAVGLAAGATGISGGSFKIPLMVLLCGVPMRVAVGTSSAMVAATALMGFLGHAAGGDFNPSWALPVAGVALIGGLLGGKVALKTKPKHLKTIFALSTLVAAVLMAVNAVSGKI
jgi:uncharacterized membrane protein YfcA